MMAMDPRDIHRARPEAVPGQGGERDLDGLLALVARGDEPAFEAVYSRLAGAAYGLIRKVVRDSAQSEEVTPGGAAGGVVHRIAV
jgi:RNA polymerase sigma-70 factor, ECF subfamily